MDYQDRRTAEIYDVINPRAADCGFYLSLAGTHPCSVLDLGCGTGTLCWALAERGHRVTGVDPSAAMLDVARRKTRADRVEWVKCDAQNYRSGRHFDWVFMTGHAFQVLLTDSDVLAVLETMRCHLEPGGKIAFETRNPQADWAEEWSARPRVVHNLPEGQMVETFENVVLKNEFVSFRTSWRFAHETVSTDSVLRFPSRAHLETLIRRSELRVHQVFGDWDGSAFHPERSREIIFVAEKADR